MINIIYNDNDLEDKLPIFGSKEFLKIKSKNFGWFIDNDFILPFYIDRKGIFSNRP